MSQKFPAIRNPPPCDDSDIEYAENRLRRFAAYASQSTSSETAASSQHTSTNASFASQPSEASILSSVASPEQRPRALHVSTILNPSPQQRESPRRGSLANLGSPRSISGPTQVRRGGAAHTPPVEFSTETSSENYHGGSYPRRLPPTLSGTGPASVRARHTHRASLSGIMSAQDNPFPYPAPRRDSPFRPGNQQTGGQISTPPGPPPLRPPPPAPPPPQSGFSFPPVSSGLSYSPGYSLSTPHSSTNNSPSSTYSSYSAQPPGQSSLSTTPTFNHAGFQSIPGTPGGTVQHGGSPYGLAGPSQSAHGTFPMMSLNTAHGTMQIPVDTTAASKIADEKRKRNAGASARFRQRRKEREREMSTRIAELEQRLKKAEDERDYYRDVIVQAQQHGGQLPQLSPALPAVSRPGEQSQTTYGHVERVSGYMGPEQTIAPSSGAVSSIGGMLSEGSGRGSYEEHRGGASGHDGSRYHAPERHD
ncbi:hypothetical protein EDC01DRAFT_627613 [Geopyxis carbonaria]|nr:hypothetical protein EDC01DRAFT_627613 [Geopyxis carbonaria]